MHIAIVGTGGVALATAALLAQNGHQATLLSISGAGAADLAGGGVTATGALDLTCTVTVTTDPAAAFAAADGIIIATSANRYRAAIDMVVPHIETRHQVLISGELSQLSRVLDAALADRQITAPITGLSTTLVTGRRGDGGSVKVGLVRKSALASTRPQDREEAALAFWNALFGGVLTKAPSALHITMSNVNPIVHIPNALCNFTRMEKGEEWSNYGGITEGVATFLLAIDQERVDLSRALDLEVKPFKRGYEDNFGFPVEMSLGEMTAALHERRGGLPKGPTTIETRYLTEDVPFGMVVFERLGELAGCPTPTISAAITVISAIYGRDFRSENPFLSALSV